MGKIRCPECRYRAAKFSDYTCDYAGITGHTRRAVPPERCRHFEPEQPLEAAKRAKPKGPAIAINPSRRRTRYDWEKAKMLYDQKWSDQRSRPPWDVMSTAFSPGGSGRSCRHGRARSRLWRGRKWWCENTG